MTLGIRSLEDLEQFIEVAVVVVVDIAVQVVSRRLFTTPVLYLRIELGIDLLDPCLHLHKLLELAMIESPAILEPVDALSLEEKSD